MGVKRTHLRIHRTINKDIKITYWNNKCISCSKDPETSKILGKKKPVCDTLSQVTSTCKWKTGKTIMIMQTQNVIRVLSLMNPDFLFGKCLDTLQIIFHSDYHLNLLTCLISASLWMHNLSGRKSSWYLKMHDTPRTLKEFRNTIQYSIIQHKAMQVKLLGFGTCVWRGNFVICFLLSQCSESWTSAKLTRKRSSVGLAASLAAVRGVAPDHSGMRRTIVAAMCWTRSSFWMLLAKHCAREHCSSRFLTGHWGQVSHACFCAAKKQDAANIVITAFQVIIGCYLYLQVTCNFVNNNNIHWNDIHIRQHKIYDKRFLSLTSESAQHSSRADNNNGIQ